MQDGQYFRYTSSMARGGQRRRSRRPEHGLRRRRPQHRLGREEKERFAVRAREKKEKERFGARAREGDEGTV